MEHAYGDWARRFILFHRTRHPWEIGAREVESVRNGDWGNRLIAASGPHTLIGGCEQRFDFRSSQEADLIARKWPAGNGERALELGRMVRCLRGSVTGGREERVSCAGHRGQGYACAPACLVRGTGAGWSGRPRPCARSRSPGSKRRKTCEMAIPGGCDRFK